MIPSPLPRPSPAAHAAVWSALDKLSERHGLSPSGLAKKAGLDATSFNRSKRALGGRLRWPSTEAIEAVLCATGETWAEFGRLVDEKLGGRG